MRPASGARRQPGLTTRCRLRGALSTAPFVIYRTECLESAARRRATSCGCDTHKRFRRIEDVMRALSATAPRPDEDTDRIYCNLNEVKMPLSLVELWSSMGWFAKGIVSVLLLMSLLVATIAI